MQKKSFASSIKNMFQKIKKVIFGKIEQLIRRKKKEQK